MCGCACRLLKDARYASLPANTATRNALLSPKVPQGIAFQVEGSNRMEDENPIKTPSDSKSTSNRSVRNSDDVLDELELPSEGHGMDPVEAMMFGTVGNAGTSPNSKQQAVVMVSARSWTENAPAIEERAAQATKRRSKPSGMTPITSLRFMDDPAMATQSPTAQQHYDHEMTPLDEDGHTSRDQKHRHGHHASAQQHQQLQSSNSFVMVSPQSGDSQRSPAEGVTWQVTSRHVKSTIINVSPSPSHSVRD